MKPSVWIVGSQYQVQNLFSKRGFQVLYNESEAIKNGANLVCFTGGEDVSPSLYNEDKFSKTHCSVARDTKETLIYEKYVDLPKVGICRGGQFLNVMSGGKLYQDVDGHRISHDMLDLLFTKKMFRVPSAHHQMMIPSKEGIVLAVAFEAKTFLSMAKEPPPKPIYDPEVIWYPNTQSLCYQSHPEWVCYADSITAPKETTHVDYFFKLIEWSFDLKGIT